MNENPISLIIKNYKETFKIFTIDKWTYLIPLLFFLPSLLLQIYFQIIQRYKFPTSFLLDTYYSTSSQTLSEKIISAINIENIIRTLSSLTLINLFSDIALIIAFLILYKKLKISFDKFSFIQDSNKKLFVILITGIIFGIIGILFKKVMVFNIGILIIYYIFLIFISLLLTIAEGVFLLLLNNLLSNKECGLKIILNELGYVYYPLLIINLILILLNPVITASVFLAADSYSYFFFNNTYDFSLSILPIINNLQEIIFYLSFFINVSLIFTPALIIIYSITSFKNSIKETLMFIKNNTVLYFLIILSGVFGFILINVFFEFLSQIFLNKFIFYSIINIAHSLFFYSLFTVFQIAIFKLVFNKRINIDTPIKLD